MLHISTEHSLSHIPLGFMDGQAKQRDNPPGLWVTVWMSTPSLSLWKSCAQKSTKTWPHSDGNEKSWLQQFEESLTWGLMMSSQHQHDSQINSQMLDQEIQDTWFLNSKTPQCMVHCSSEYDNIYS